LAKLLINNIPGPIFWHDRGLRQGPMSPYYWLIVLFMDVLLVILHGAKEFGVFSNLWSPSLHYRVSPYPDNMLVFVKPLAPELDASCRIRYIVLWHDIQAYARLQNWCNFPNLLLLTNNWHCHPTLARLVITLPCKDLELSIYKLQKMMSNLSLIS
jgi:hypothetical protein